MNIHTLPLQLPPSLLNEYFNYTISNPRHALDCVLTIHNHACIIMHALRLRQTKLICRAQLKRSISCT